MSWCVEYATDIADVFPQKRVTLLHSRKQLLPKYKQSMHDESKFRGKRII